MTHVAIQEDLNGPAGNGLEKASDELYPGRQAKNGNRNDGNQQHSFDDERTKIEL
jgi:hypothetical protein